MRLVLKKSLLRQTCQEPAGAALGVSGSGARAAMASTREAQPMAASMGEQTEEGASGAPVVGVAQPGVATTSQAKVA